jgi:hypothetical protein
MPRAPLPGGRRLNRRTIAVVVLVAGILIAAVPPLRNGVAKPFKALRDLVAPPSYPAVTISSLRPSGLKGSKVTCRPPVLENQNSVVVWFTHGMSTRQALSVNFGRPVSISWVQIDPIATNQTTNSQLPYPTKFTLQPPNAAPVVVSMPNTGSQTVGVNWTGAESVQIAVDSAPGSLRRGDQCLQTAIDFLTSG